MKAREQVEPTSNTMLGKILRVWRKSLGYTLNRVSIEIGITVNTLSRIERGYMPDLDTYKKIEDWLLGRKVG